MLSFCLLFFLFIAILSCFYYFGCQVLKLIVYRQNKVFRADSNPHIYSSWVKYDDTFVINWERESATSHILQTVHPCYLWLANYFFEQRHFHSWYKEVNDNIRPPNYNDNNDNNDDNDNKDDTNNKNENNYSYSWFKMNCFMSVAFNCTRYTFAHYQTQIAKSALEVCTRN